MGIFFAKYQNAKRQKKSILCIGLDPALPQQRNQNTIPENIMNNKEESEARLQFCLEILEQTAEFACAAKANQQYIFGFTKNQHKKLANTIRSLGLVSIYDCKLNDIDDTVESALFHISDCGYDSITFTPFAGNISSTVAYAHKNNMSIIVFVLPSNPESVNVVKLPKINGESLYRILAKEAKAANADGIVVGATGHVTEEDIKTVRSITGENIVFLVPGIGAQRGDAKKVLNAAGDNLIANVSRGIMYDADPREAARKYNEMLNSFRKLWE